MGSIILACGPREHPLGPHTRPRYSRGGESPLTAFRGIAGERQRGAPAWQDGGVRSSTIPLATGLPIRQLPLSPLMHAIVRLRLAGLGYKRIARELRMTRDQARDYARSVGLGGVRGEIPRARHGPAAARARSCAYCGDAIALHPRGRPAKFCSRRCRDAMRYAARISK